MEWLGLYGILSDFLKATGQWAFGIWGVLVAAVLAVILYAVVVGGVKFGGKQPPAPSTVEVHPKNAQPDPQPGEAKADTPAKDEPKSAGGESHQSPKAHPKGHHHGIDPGPLLQLGLVVLLVMLFALGAARLLYWGSLPANRTAPAAVASAAAVAPPEPEPERIACPVSPNFRGLKPLETVVVAFDNCSVLKSSLVIGHERLPSPEGMELHRLTNPNSTVAEIHCHRATHLDRCKTPEEREAQEALIKDLY